MYYSVKSPPILSTVAFFFLICTNHIASTTPNLATYTGSLKSINAVHGFTSNLTLLALIIICTYTPWLTELTMLGCGSNTSLVGLGSIRMNIPQVFLLLPYQAVSAKHSRHPKRACFPTEKLGEKESKHSLQPSFLNQRQHGLCS